MTMDRDELKKRLDKYFPMAAKCDGDCLGDIPEGWGATHPC
jgi:hypothetical protein